MSRPAGALALLILAATGCGADDGVTPVSAADLAAEISSRMEEEVGVAPAVECPSELPAELGATATCTIAASAEVTTALVVVATVTAVDAEQRLVMFDIGVTTAEEATPMEESGPPSTPPTTEPPAEPAG